MMLFCVMRHFSLFHVILGSLFYRAASFPPVFVLLLMAYPLTQSRHSTSRHFPPSQARPHHMNRPSFSREQSLLFASSISGFYRPYSRVSARFLPSPAHQPSFLSGEKSSPLPVTGGPPFFFPILSLPNRIWQSTLLSLSP